MLGGETNDWKPYHVMHGDKPMCHFEGHDTYADFERLVNTLRVAGVATDVTAHYSPDSAVVEMQIEKQVVYVIHNEMNGLWVTSKKASDEGVPEGIASLIASTLRNSPSP